MEILQQKPDTKRPEIVRAAITLFSQRGIDGTSMREIAQAAGVREAAIYRHFAGKEELAREIFLSWYVWHCQQVKQIVTGSQSTKEKLHSIVRQEFTVAQSYSEAFLYFCENEPKFISLLPPGVPSVRKIFIELIKGGQSREELKKGDPELMADMLSGALCGVALSWVRRQPRGNLNRHVALVAEGCWHMLAA
jgi:AcrR family transcriptional regulator